MKTAIDDFSYEKRGRQLKLRSRAKNSRDQATGPILALLIRIE
jgi:hypothetical protein